MRSAGTFRVCLSCFIVVGIQLVLCGVDSKAQNIAPYKVGLQTPKLTTPQWVGESGVDAVVVLSIDDMREIEKYETFLRPLLDRLKKIDGRAPVSIFTNSIDPGEPHLQTWLKEGLSLEVHTVDHPCPLLSDGDFAKAKSTYDRCVDMMESIPNSKPVAFRMPCCDSLNTPSPRFRREIFEKQTEKSNYLAIDSSVFNIFTADDPDLDPKLTKNEKGESRFRKYVPFKSFVNTVENYPYPYIIGDTCWEFPCVVPSDWEAQYVQKPNNPDTVRDLQRALDATVAKQGVMPIVFHPHGWIRSEQLVEFIDYADKTYGKRVKFLNFAECLERINKNLLGGMPLRTEKGNEHDVQLADLNSDGFLDVLRSTHPTDDSSPIARIWNPDRSSFHETKLIFTLQDAVVISAKDYGVSYVSKASESWGHCRSVGASWLGFMLQTKRVLSGSATVSAHDIDGDGTDELLATDDSSTVVLIRSGVDAFEKAEYQFPSRLSSNGKDVGTRLVDLNNDGRLDVVHADGAEYGVWLFADSKSGWQKVRSGEATDADAIPVIANPDGTNNGAWFHSNHLWVQNENTAKLPDHVDRASFEQLTSVKVDQQEHPLGKAKSLEESLKTFQLADGCKLEVVASEPQIKDPIAFDWGADGKLWVVEMSDYPNGANWHGPGDKKNDPGGRVKILEDKDNDGRFETAHVFLDGLSYPTGVKAWRGGAIISGAPNIIYAEDTDGDYKADVQKVLYEGLAEGNQQHRINGMRWSSDMWLHLANGESGGKVRSKKTGNEVSISGRDFRIQPDEGLLETTSGATQSVRSRDRFGNWFGGNNSHPIWHYVLEEKYMRRNPHFSPPSARREIAEVPGAGPVFPTSETLERFNDFDRANRFTSACSAEIYRGQHQNEATAKFHKAFYVCEPVHNLVHRSEITKLGPTFRSRRFKGEEQREFLTSSDNWFRPVMVRTGPDGAMWIADMYRMVIEHPEWIPRSWQDRIDHLAGNDKGRIYRVRLPRQASRDGVWKTIRDGDLKKLAELLKHENHVIRDMAQQEIYERNDRAVISHLHESVTNVQASNLLAHFEAREPPDPRHLAYAWALRLIEPMLKDSLKYQIEVMELADRRDWKSDPRLAMQCAYTLGEIDDSRGGKGLAKIALYYVGADDSHDTDKYVRAAVMSSVTRKNCDVLMKSFLDGLQHRGTERANEFLNPLIKSAIGYQSKSTIKNFIEAATASRETLEQFSEPISVLLTTIDRKGARLTDYVDTKSLASLEAFAEREIDRVADPNESEEDRLAALQVFGFFEKAKQREQEALTALLSPRESQQLQRAAIERLAKTENAETAKAVLERWSSFSPAIRDYVLSSSMDRPKWTEAVLSSIETRLFFRCKSVFDIGNSC